MLKYYAAFLFVLAALSAPVWAADVGHDCAEGAEEYTPSQTVTPIPTPPAGS